MNKQRYLKKSISVLVFTIPALIPLFVFWVYPICRSVWISFTDWDYMTPTYHFVFLKNYISLFKDTRFYEALLNTFIFTIGKYSLQGTTQGNGLTGGVSPVRFSM